MPIQECSVKGVKGWRWGKSGKCYPGEGGKAKAAKQGQAIRATGWTENVRRASIRIMKSDPTRTKTLRKRFERDIGMRFIALKRAIIALIVEEDAFGLNLNRPFNQERDNDVHTSQNDGTHSANPSNNFHGGDNSNRSVLDREEQSDDEDSKSVSMVRLYRGASGDSDSQAVDLSSGVTLNQEREDGDSYDETPDLYDFSSGVATHDRNRQTLNQKEQDNGRYHPPVRTTASTNLERSSVPNSLHFRLTSQASQIINQRFAFQSAPEQVASFEEWIKGQLDGDFVNPGDPYWEAYVRQGYEKGAGRAFDDTYRARRALSGSAEQQAFFDGTREQFLETAFGQTESIEKVKLLASRTLTDLRGVSGSVATRMGRILTDGLIQGMGPRAIARIMTRDLDIDKRRAQTIARTEIIRAHAEGQLDALEQMGVEEVGVMVEWSTAGDDRVCPLCQSLEGVVLKIKEARGIIPRHPNCRCAFIPANVGEPKTRRVNFGEGTQEIGQTKSKAGIERAIKTSVSRERKAGTLKEKLKRSRWRGADKASTIAKVRPKSILEPGVVPAVPKKITPKPPSRLKKPPTVSVGKVNFLVDAKGKPLTLHHGTDAKFNQFSVARVGSVTDEGMLGKGFYFSTDPNIASSNTYRMAVNLQSTKPLKLSMETWGTDKRKLVRSALGLPENASANSVNATLKKAGYDSVILDYSKLGYNHQEIVVFAEKQITVISRINMATKSVVKITPKPVRVVTLKPKT